MVKIYANNNVILLMLKNNKFNVLIHVIIIQKMNNN